MSYSRNIIVFLSIVLTIFINIIANILPFNEKYTWQISDSYPVLFIPAGYVFMIWGVIYVGLVAYGIYQITPEHRDSKIVQRLAPFSIVTSIANIGWIFCWHYLTPMFAAVPLVILLITLIMMYVIIKNEDPKKDDWFKWAVKIPTSIYLAWISVATISNLAIVLYTLEFNLFNIGDGAWAVIMIFVAAAIGAVVYMIEFDLAFVFVVIWALVGIAVKQPVVSIKYAVIFSLFVLILPIIQKLRKDEIDAEL